MKEIREAQMKERGRKESVDCARPLEDKVTAYGLKKLFVSQTGEMSFNIHGKHIDKINGL
jgi:hypothetical protein